MTLDTLVDPNNKIKHYVEYVTKTISMVALEPFFKVLISYNNQFIVR